MIILLSLLIGIVAGLRALTAPAGVAWAAYLGSGYIFDRAILDFSEAYAEQNDRDYRALVEAAKTGRVHTQHSF